LAVRVAVAVAYGPALLWSDSWAYVLAAYTGDPVGILVDRPIGYPSLIHILGTPGRSLTVITTVQHVAGLVGGVLVYALLRGRGIRGLVAAAAAGVVLLDSFAVALEHHILSEAFFTLALVLWAFITVQWGRTTSGVALAGLALAAAVTIRAVALFIIPVWLVYCLWSYPDLRRRVVATVSVATPLLCYAAVHQAVVGGFGLTQMNGYLLYARVGQIADCGGLNVSPNLRPLCPRGRFDEFEIHGPRFHGDHEYFYLLRAARLVGDPGGYDDNEGHLSSAQLADASDRLAEFGLEVVKARPLEFARLVGATTLKFVTPGAMSPIADFDRPILFPASPRPIAPQHQAPLEQFFPGYVARTDPPSGALREYQQWVHTPRWLLAGLILVAFVEMLALVSRSGPSRLAHRREVFVLVGGGLALLLGAALNRFEPRYLIPAVPLIMSGGVLAVSDLAAATARWRRPSGEHARVGSRSEATDKAAQPETRV
jgi:hypothetical protein